MKFLLLFLLFCIGRITYGQEINIQTDRPDQSDGTFTMPLGGVQLETGVTYDTFNSALYHEIFYRLGLSTSTEFRMILDYGRFEDNVGLNPVGFSLKQSILKQKGVIPDISVVGYIYPEITASKALKTSYLPADLKMAFNYEFVQWLSLGLNVGVRWDGESEQAQRVWSSCVECQLCDSWTTFAEYFGNYEIEHSSFQNNFDTGILYVINPNLQWDAAVGIYDGSFKNIFCTSGLSIRFK